MMGRDTREVPRLDVQRYRAICRSARVTGVDLARALGVREGRYYQIANGWIRLAFDQAASIAAHLAVPLDAILYVPDRLPGSITPGSTDEAFLALPAAARFALARAYGIRNPQAAPEIRLDFAGVFPDPAALRAVMRGHRIRQRDLYRDHRLSRYAVEGALHGRAPATLEVAVTVARLAGVRYRDLTPGVPLEGAADLAYAGWQALPDELRRCLAAVSRTGEVPAALVRCAVDALC